MSNVVCLQIYYFTSKEATLLHKLLNSLLLLYNFKCQLLR